MRRHFSSGTGGEVLSIKNVITGYGKVQILNGINLSVSEGQVIALLGGNGTGKSTLLKAISGLLPVWDGIIEFMGEVIQNRKPNVIVKKGLTQVTQGKDMYPGMSVEENLKIGAYTRNDKVGVAEDIKTASTLLFEIASFGEFATLHPNKFATSFAD